MIARHSVKSILAGLALLAALETMAMAADPAAPNSEPGAGIARVWFLRPSSFSNPEVDGAAPMIYVNGAPIGAIPANAAFYRDFAPGKYSFTAQPYGLPTGNAETGQLAPGTQTYFEVQWDSAWQQGYASGGPGDMSHSFFIRNLSPELAQAYLPTLTYLGQN